VEKRNLPTETFKSRGIFLDYLLSHVNARYSLTWLWLIFVFEIFLLLPLDFVIVFYALQHRGKAIFLSITAAACSTLSALFGYLIGMFFFEKFSYYIFKLISPLSFAKTAVLYQTYEKTVVFLGTLLPLPFKLITISAGICKISLLVFLLMVFFARCCRFLFISLITIRLKDRIFDVIEKYSQKVLVLAILLFLVIWLWSIW